MRRNALRVLLPNYPHSEEVEQYIEQITRRSVGLLWAFGGFQFSVFTFHLSVFGVPLYNIVMPYLRHFSSFVPKIYDFERRIGVFF